MGPLSCFNFTQDGGLNFFFNNDVKLSVKGELKPKIELISFDSQSDEILDFKRYLC